MSQIEISSHSRIVAALTDDAIEALEHQITDLRKTIAMLVADGHVVQDATKQFREMNEKLRLLKSRST